MSVINLSSEDEDDECFIINSDEEQTTLQKSHTVLIVVDDDETNDINGELPELEHKMKPGHLPIRDTEEETSEDPFAMCAELDVMDSGNKEGILSIENTLLNANVKPVYIENIIEDSTKNTIFEKNNETKLIKPNTDDTNRLMNTIKEIPTVAKDNLTDCCKSLNGAKRDNNNKENVASFNKRLAERLALLIKDKAVQTNNSSNSSGQDEHLSLGRENMTNVDDIINEVSKSSFHVDWYIDLLSKQNEDIEGSKNNIFFSTENEGNQGCLEYNACEPCGSIIANKKKRGRKKGWRKHPQTNLNGLSSKQESNRCDRNQRLNNRCVKESSDISNHGSGHIKKGDVSGMVASVNDISISHHSTQQTQTHCDSKISSSNLDQKPNSKTQKIKVQSLVSKTSCKDGIPTVSEALNTFIEDMCNNSLLGHEIANNNRCIPKLHSPPPLSLNPPKNVSTTDVDSQSCQRSGKSCLGVIKAKQDIANQQTNTLSTVCKTALSCESPKRVVAGLNGSNENEINARLKLIDACTTELIASKQSENNSPSEFIASKQSENNPPCLQHEKYEASGGHRKITIKSKEKLFNVYGGLPSRVIRGRGLQDNDTQNTAIDCIVSFDQNSLNQNSMNSELKTYTHYYNIVFDDNGEYLCMKMGDRVLLTVKEARSCKSRIITAEKFTCQQLRANEVQLAKTNFYQALVGFRSSFVPLYFKLFYKIIASEVHLKNYEHLSLLILTWFLKMYLRVTTLAPEFMDCLNEIKVSVQALIPKENPISKPINEVFACNETEFESKCCTVVQYMHHIFNSSQSLKQDECNDRKEKKSLQILNQPIKNVQGPETTVHIDEQYVNVQSVENSLVVSKPLSMLENLLNSNDISVKVKNNSKALELQKLDPPPYNCKKTSIERHQDKPGVGESKEHGSIVRDSRLRRPFKNAMSTLSKPAENSSQGHASVSSSSNNHNTKDQELMQPNLTERGIPISKTVTSNLPLPVDVRLCNNLATRYGNQMPKSSGISASSEGSRVTYSSTNINVPFEPQLDIGTIEMNQQVKRKCKDSQPYSTKRLVTNQDYSISNKWAGKDNMCNYPLNHFQPSSTVNNAQFNSKTYTRPDQIRSTSLYRHPPPPYSSYQYHHPYQNYSQPNNVIQKQSQGQPTSAGYYQFQENPQVSTNYKHHFEIRENNQYSSGVNNSRNYGNSPSTNSRPLNETVQKNTTCNEGHIAVTINNYNIINGVPPTSVIKHVSSHKGTSWSGLQKDAQLEKGPLVQEPVPKETIHYLS